MGLIRFLVHPPERLADDMVGRAYFSGPDSIPWKSRNLLSDGELVIERAVDDSGNLNVPWIVEDRGELSLATGTLMQRDEPYSLVVELARGTIHRVRNQIAEWQEVGLVVPAVVTERLHHSVVSFSHAATEQADPAAACARAEQAIIQALDASDALTQAYCEQALAVRHRQSKQLETLLGVNVGSVPPSIALSSQVRKALNAASVPVNWHEIESREGQYDWDLNDAQIDACNQHGLHVTAGPLIEFDPVSLPDWLCLWEGDFQNLLSVVTDYVETVVGRYRGRVRLWHCAGRLSAKGVLSLSEEEKLQLAVCAVEATQRIDQETPIIVSFNQPWGESLAGHEMDLPPLHLADALARSGLRLGGLGLEINVGYWPGGTDLREMLAFSHMIDLWSCLGLPLYVMLCIPSAGGDDPLATSQSAPVTAAPKGAWTPAVQEAWVAKIIPLLLSKPTVRSICWSQLSDEHVHSFAHGGLLDRSGKAKPALKTLAALRRAHLR